MVNLHEWVFMSAIVPLSIAYNSRFSAVNAVYNQTIVVVLVNHIP